jgi:hypothetical protein
LQSVDVFLPDVIIVTVRDGRPFLSITSITSITTSILLLILLLRSLLSFTSLTPLMPTINLPLFPPLLVSTRYPRLLTHDQPRLAEIHVDRDGYVFTGVGGGPVDGVAVGLDVRRWRSL